MHAPDRIGSLWAEVGAFLLGAQCAGCDEPGTFLCAVCHAALTSAPRSMVTAGGLTVHAAHSFEGVPARMIRMIKEQGMTGALRPLAQSLDQLLAVVAPTEEVALVPIPTTARSFRRRGYRVPDMLIAQAGRQAFPALKYVRRIADQRGLGRSSRATNMQYAMVARGEGLSGRSVILIDDVCTTGATLDEAFRALQEIGVAVLFAATTALTPRANDTA